MAGVYIWRLRAVCRAADISHSDAAGDGQAVLEALFQEVLGRCGKDQWQPEQDENQAKQAQRHG
jgi:hypothetical protein